MKTHQLLVVLGSLLVASSCSQSNHKPNPTPSDNPKAYVRTTIATNPLQGSIYLTEGHKNWADAVKRTETAIAQDPAKSTEVYWRVLRAATTGQPDVRPDFPDYSLCRETDLTDGMKTVGYLCQNIHNITSFLTDNITFQEDPNFEQNLESYAEKLLDDPIYRQKLTATFPFPPDDCKMNAVTAAGLHLAHIASQGTQPTPIDVVLGLVYDKTYAPNGFGHCWVNLDGKIIDGAMDKQMKPEDYVPIIGVRLSFKPSDMSCGMAPRVYCFTPDMMKSF